MPRPVKPRKVGYIPEHKRFYPEGIKDSDVDVIILLHDEVEALRLKDIENLNQAECAEIMDISRQTFQLIIDKAHEKIANAIVFGKSIQIEGGNYIISDYAYRCPKCGRVRTEENCPKRRKCCKRCQNED